MNRERKARLSLEGTHLMSHHGPSAVTRLKGNKLLHWPPAQCLFQRAAPCRPPHALQASALRKSDILCLKLI